MNFNTPQKYLTMITDRTVLTLIESKNASQYVHELMQKHRLPDPEYFFTENPGQGHYCVGKIDCLNLSVECSGKSKKEVKGSAVI
jgi:hypothetical protein